MSVVRSIVRRQEGFESIQDYDIALYRLKCYYNDVYHGISLDTNIADYTAEPPVFACRFCSMEGCQEILALANEDGKIALRKASCKGKSNLLLPGTRAHYNAIFDVAWMPGEMKLVTASGDHTARLWDVSTSEIKQLGYFHAHSRSVKTAVFRHQDKAVFATGARDGSIMVWDIRANHSDLPKPDNCISNAHSGSISSKYRRSFPHFSCVQSITGLAFQDDFSLLSCAAGDGLIKVWDLRKNYTIYKKDPIAKNEMSYSGNSARNGFSSLLVCPAKITLYASCMDNVIYAYNISSYNPKPVAEFYGHQNCTYYVKTCLSPDGRYLASGSSDELAYIWHTNRPGGPLVKLSGHTEEVTCISWCSVGETQIVTCSDDSCHRIWRVGFEHKTNDDEIKICGQAEIVYNTALVKSSEVETTPTVGSQRVSSQAVTPDSDDATNTTPGPSDMNKPGSSKRTYFQMIHGGPWSDGKCKTILSPILENMEATTKRAHLENRGARRLFSSSTEIVSACNKGYETDEPSTSSSGNKSSILFSPTSNLPNFVVDGTAPHLLQISPQKSKENVDWLTKIRREKYEQKVKISVEKRLSSPQAVTPVRRNSRSKSLEPQKASKTPKSSGPSLLDFFRATTSNCDKNNCFGNRSINSIPSTTTS